MSLEIVGCCSSDLDEDVAMVVFMEGPTDGLAGVDGKEASCDESDDLTNSAALFEHRELSFQDLIGLTYLNRLRYKVAYLICALLCWLLIQNQLTTEMMMVMLLFVVFEIVRLLAYSM